MAARLLYWRRCKEILIEKKLWTESEIEWRRHCFLNLLPRMEGGSLEAGVCVNVVCIMQPNFAASINQHTCFLQSWYIQLQNNFTAPISSESSSGRLCLADNRASRGSVGERMIDLSCCRHIPTKVERWDWQIKVPQLTHIQSVWFSRWLCNGALSSRPKKTFRCYFLLFLLL